MITTNRDSGSSELDASVARANHSQPLTLHIFVLVKSTSGLFVMLSNLVFDLRVKGGFFARLV